MDTTKTSAERAGVTIGHKNDPAFGGDCARVVSRHNARSLCFLGDVTGHDRVAFRLARHLEHLIGVLAGRATPAGLLTRLNAVIEAGWPSDRLVSAVCFSFDPETGRGVVALAGLLPPIVKSAEGAFPLKARGGPALGFMAGHSFEEQAFCLQADEVLVAATDGITDAMAAGSDVLGVSGWSRLVRAAPTDADGICSSLLRAARRSVIKDDATVLAATPALSRAARRDAWSPCSLTA